jgi:hypothetical protein
MINVEMELRHMPNEGIVFNFGRLTLSITEILTLYSQMIPYSGAPPRIPVGPGRSNAAES